MSTRDIELFNAMKLLVEEVHGRALWDTMGSLAKKEGEREPSDEAITEFVKACEPLKILLQEHIAERLRELLEQEKHCASEHLSRWYTAMTVHGDVGEAMRVCLSEDD